MNGQTRLIREEFIEMLERGDAPEAIAHAAGISVRSVARKFFRLPKPLRAEIIKQHPELSRLR